MTQPFSNQDRERLEVLAGTRTGGLANAAVRVKDLAPLLALPAMRSTSLSGPPGAADYEALRADVKELHSRLFKIAEVIAEKAR